VGAINLARTVGAINLARTGRAGSGVYYASLLIIPGDARLSPPEQA
jgi:hypothetical protein